MYSQVQHALAYAWHVFVGTLRNRDWQSPVPVPAYLAVSLLMQENNSTGVERNHMGAGVTRILSQVNVTETVARHLCLSSSEQLHQMLLW